MRDLFLPAGQNSIFKIKISLFSNCVIIAGRTINPLFVNSPRAYASIYSTGLPPRSNNLVFSHSYANFAFQNNFFNFFRKIGMRFDKIFSSLDFYGSTTIGRNQENKNKYYFLHNLIFTIKRGDCQDG